MLNPLSQISSLLGGSPSPPSATQRQQDYLQAIQARDYETALPRIEAAVRNGDPIAMRYLGTYYAFGLASCAKDPESASAWYRQAAVHGDAKGQCALGINLAIGSGAPLDLEEAAFWLYKACCQRDPIAAKALGQLVYQNPRLIGKYFSEDELMRLINDARKVELRKHTSHSSPDRAP